MTCIPEPTINELGQKVCETDVYKCAFKSFADLNLQEDLLKGVTSAEGLEKPTDLLRKFFAAWNTGKSVVLEEPSEKLRHHTLCLAVLKKIDTNSLQCQSVILTSTKDKAVHIQKVLSSFGVHMNVKSYVVMGGESIKEDIAHLQAGVHVVLGTTGRICEMITRKIISTDHLTLFAVENLNDVIGSKSGQQISKIFGLLNNTYQLIALSSMMHKSIIKQAQNLVHSPDIFELGERLVSVEHVYFCVPSADAKLAALMNYFGKKKISPTVIFCNSWRRVDYLMGNLNGQDFCCLKVHSRMKSKEQQENISKYCVGSALVLIASVDLATSIVNSSTHTVIHFDVPKVADDYMQAFSHICPKISLSIVTSEEKNMFLKVGEEYCLPICETSF